MSSSAEYPPLSEALSFSRKRTYAVFDATHRLHAPGFAPAQRVRVAAAVLDGYRGVALPASAAPAGARAAVKLTAGGGAAAHAAAAPLLLRDATDRERGDVAGRKPILSAVLQSGDAAEEVGAGASLAATSSTALVAFGAAAAVGDIACALASRAAPAGIAAESQVEFARIEAMREVAAAHSREMVARRAPPRVLEPRWHAPWKLHRVISGHTGWVRSIAFEPGNEWFATGSADRTIKIWDLASGSLKLTLTGHINAVRALVVSPRHPYMFSAGEDKMVKCWDLETNKVIRSYDAHLSGVYSLALHPTLDILFSGGRDSSVRVWDVRTRTQIHVLSGHESSVSALLTNAADPQVICG